MTALTKIGSYGGSPTGGATITKVAGLAAGDIQVIEFSADSPGATINITGGATWNRIGGAAQSITNGDGQTVTAFYQIAGASEPASYTVTNSNGAALSYSGVVLRGTGTLSLDGTPVVVSANGGTAPTSPIAVTATTLTTSGPDVTLVFMGSVDFSATTTMTWSTPTGFTLADSQVPAQFSNSICAYANQAAAGPTGSVTSTATMGTAIGNFAAYLVAVKDSANAGGGGGSSSVNLERGNGRGMLRGMRRAA